MPLEPPSVSGTLACSLREHVCDLVGRQTVDEALRTVPETTRSLYESATAVGWVPIETMEAVFSAIADRAGLTVAELHERVARQSIERTFRTVWRMLLRLTTDRALVSRAPVIFSKSYNRGRLVAEFPVRGRAEVRLEDWPDVPEWPLRATRIGVETVLRVAGRRRVRVRTTRTEDGALFTAEWDV